MPTSITDQRMNNRSPKGIYKGTREEWLEDSAQIMGTWLNEFITIQDIKEHNKNRQAEHMTLRRFKLSDVAFRCGITSSRSDYRMTHTTAGQIVYDIGTGNGKSEIVISNRLNGSKTKIGSSYIAHVVLHEMVHQCTPYHGHKGQFKRLAQSVGMTGKMTATTNGEDLEKRMISEVINVLGKFPHKAVTSTVTRKGSRMLKVQCSKANCAIIMRASAKVCEMINGQPCPACFQGQLIAEGV
jgi:hypothetical protein